jgi:hypothetical protein
LIEIAAIIALVLTAPWWGAFLYGVLAGILRSPLGLIFIIFGILALIFL